MTKSRPGIPGAPKCISLIRNLQLNTSTMIKKIAAEYFDHPRLSASALDTSDLNPNTQVTTNCKKHKQHKTKNSQPKYNCNYCTNAIYAELSRLIHVLQDQVSATYVPSHLHHILFEIFKNSMRATCEFAEKKGSAELPVWVFIVQELNGDVVGVDVPPYYWLILQDKV